MLRVNGIEYDKPEQTGIDRAEKGRTGYCIEKGHNGTCSLEQN